MPVCRVVLLLPPRMGTDGDLVTPPYNTCNQIRTYLLCTRILTLGSIGSAIVSSILSRFQRSSYRTANKQGTISNETINPHLRAADAFFVNRSEGDVILESEFKVPCNTGRTELYRQTCSCHLFATLILRSVWSFRIPFVRFPGPNTQSGTDSHCPFSFKKVIAAQILSTSTSIL